MLKNSHRLDLGGFISNLIRRSIPLMVLIILCILIINCGLSDFWVRVSSIDTESGLYWMLLNIAKVSVMDFNLLWVILIVCSIILMTGILLIAKDYYKNKLLIIKHSSLNVMNFKMDGSELKDYSIEKLILNQFETMENTQFTINEKITVAINEQTAFMKEVRDYISKGYSLAYIGIAHTPFIFFLGFLAGDENDVKLFHKRRDDTNEDKFRLLIAENYTEKLVRQPDQSPTKQFDTMLLCIETTFKIPDDDIVYICQDVDCVLRYSTVNKGYDVIYSAKQIKEYTNTIKNDLHEICTSSNVKKIKICIASSVAFTFALAQAFSDNHDPEIEIYHYDKKNDLKYPWGINITKKAAIIV